MPESKWSSFTKADPEAEYLALISYLWLKSSWLSIKPFWMIPRFITYTRSIPAQLGSAEGLLGYSLRGDLLRPKLWTLSVWQNENALMEFVQTSPHDRAMAFLRPHVAETKFVRWKVTGSAIPPPWGEALMRLEVDNPRYA